MNKKLIIILAIVLIGTVGWFVLKPGQVQEKTKTDEKNLSSTATQSNLKTACDIYTLDVAKKYLGESAKKGSTAGSDSKTEGNDTIVSSCLYENDAEISGIINIQLIAAKNDNGKSWNKSSFENSPKETAELTEEEPPVLENIDGTGEKAYWNPQLGQLCVLVNDGQYWLTVQGSINSTDEEKAQLRQMAQDLVEKL